MSGWPPLSAAFDVQLSYDLLTAQLVDQVARLAAMLISAWSWAPPSAACESVEESKGLSAWALQPLVTAPARACTSPWQSVRALTPAASVGPIGRQTMSPSCRHRSHRP